MPFVAAGGADANPPLEVMTNVVFFLPFGIHLALLAPRLPWWAAGLIAAG